MKAITLSSIIVLSSFYIGEFCHAAVVDSMPSPVLIEMQDKLVDEQNIRETVFRFQFEHNSSGQQQNAKVYFLSLDQNRDPSNDLMIRFKSHKPPVRKASRASISARGVIDKKSGQRGLLFRITAIKWVAQDEVDVEGGYFESGHSASSNVYKLKRENGQWIIKENKLIEIS